MISVIASSETVSIEKLNAFISASVTPSDDGIAIEHDDRVAPRTQEEQHHDRGDEDRLESVRTTPKIWSSV